MTSVASVQLVACVFTHQISPTSCGNYTRQSDGLAGQLTLANAVSTIKIVVARTGAVIGWKAIRRHTVGRQQ